MENTMPNTRAEKKPSTSPVNRPPPWNRFTRNTPRKFRPKNTTIRPVTRFTAVWWSRSSWPKVPARAPRATNTRVKPRINPRALVTVFFVSRWPPPEKYETYTGSMGSRQGEMKVMIPSKNEMKYCMAGALLSVPQT